MKYVLAVIVALALPVSAAAFAAPSARFAQASPAEALERLASGCVERGFEIRSRTTDLVQCTAPGLENVANIDIEAMPESAGAPRTNLTFHVQPSGEDALVTTSISVELRLPRGRGTVLDGNGRAFFRIHSRLRTFLTALGAVDVR